MWIQSTFSYNDARNLSIYKNIYFKSYDKIKSSRSGQITRYKVATLPVSRYHAIYTI